MTRANTPSSTEIGDSFRDLVCELLRTRFFDAKPEQFIGGTKVDIAFLQPNWGRHQRVAVECKNYDRPLTKADFEGIYAKYQPMLDSRSVDQVLIVSNKPIGAAALAYVNNWRGASHQTFRELEESLLGLRPYIEGLAKLVPTADAKYVEARFEDPRSAGESALDEIQAWALDPVGNSLAILGSYGQGKTSLARRIAAYFASSYLANPTKRIPILKSLGDVVHETRLEGLFGAQFTADSPAPGFQFKTFEHLNRSGRLLVILDGFDEMKHAMTASDFLSNFREFNRLLVGHSKVILLGRPNALPTDTQHLVFRGLKNVAGQSVASTEFAQWKERTLSFFSEKESRQLLQSSLESSANRYEVAKRFTYPHSFVGGRTAEVLDRVPRDLLARPVHVQLIAELAADPGFDFEGFNRYSLYDHFIRSMVERDTTQKPARKAVALNDRLQFQRDLAWWAWRRPGKSQGSFLRDEIPESLLAQLPDGNSADFEGKRNEYIVSTLTEEKEAGALFFAHRSFQEFLVAERLRLAKPDPNAHIDYSAHLTLDIIAFLTQAPDVHYIAAWYDTLRVCPGPLNGAYLRFFASFTSVAEAMAGSARSNVASIDLWTTAIVTLASRAKTLGALEAAELDSFLLQAVRGGKDDTAAVAALALWQSHSRTQPQLTALAAALLERVLRKSREESDSSALSIEAKHFDFSANWVGKGIQKIFAQPGKTDGVRLNLDGGMLIAMAMGEINAKLPEGLMVFSDGIETTKFVEVEAERVFALVDKDLRKTHDGFLRGRRLNYNVVSFERSRTSTGTFGRSSNGQSVR
ncbi:NACHT domain-containing protein [Roseateles sp. P5_D6]